MLKKQTCISLDFFFFAYPVTDRFACMQNILLFSYCLKIISVYEMVSSAVNYIPFSFLSPHSFFLSPPSFISSLFLFCSHQAWLTLLNFFQRVKVKLIFSFQISTLHMKLHPRERERELFLFNQSS